MKEEGIIPDRESFGRIEREYPDKSAGEKYQLMQADTLMRLMKTGSMNELERMAQGELMKDLIREHNRKMRKAGLPDS